MSSSLTPVSNHQTLLHSVLSTPSNSATLPAASSLGVETLKTVLSGNLQSAASGMMMASETVAPCMKGANKNKALVKEVSLLLLLGQKTVL